MGNNHGGKREGSGRKPKDSTYLSLKVPTQIIIKLNNKFGYKENPKKAIKDRNKKIVDVLDDLSNK